MEEQLYCAEAAKEIGIGVSTLRKYAAFLEGKGYIFERGVNNGRIFGEGDMNLIRLMLEKMEKEQLSINEAVNQVFPLMNQTKKTTHPIETDLSEFIEQMKKLETQQTALAAMNEALVKQVEMLTQKIEERERDQQLFQLLEEAREKKKKRGTVFLRPLTVLAGKK